jgi:hypothetical protein
MKKEARKPEELKKANIEHATEFKQKTSTIESKLTNQEIYNAATGLSEHNNLLGFSGEDYETSYGEGRGRGRGGRGGRGGYQGGDRGDRGDRERQPRTTGGKRNNDKHNLNVNEDSFPTL